MSAKKKKTTGMVLGKFMPLHKGHESLLNFAAGFCDQLYVVTDWQEAIDGEIRCKWIRATMPQAAGVFYLDKPHPQTPEEHPDFWSIWQKSLLAVLPEKIDYVFASETYGFKLAEVLGATFIPFDMKRESISISATRIREDVFGNWDYLSAAARRDYLARICIFGPESSGKSTLAQQLAGHFNTSFVPEYARFFIETRGAPKKEDMLHIARGQIALEEAIAPRANRYLFCDTDPLATTIWSRWILGDCSKELSRLAEQKNYSLYLLTAADLPWKEDAVRYFPGKGGEFFSSCKEALEKLNRPYFIVQGKGGERLENAIRIIQSEKKNLFRLFKSYQPVF